MPSEKEEGEEEGLKRETARHVVGKPCRTWPVAFGAAPLYRPAPLSQS